MHEGIGGNALAGFLVVTLGAALGCAADIDACVTDINAATCASLDVTSGGTLPASCVGVVRSSLGSTPSALLSATRSPGERIGDIVAR